MTQIRQWHMYDPKAQMSRKKFSKLKNLKDTWLNEKLAAEPAQDSAKFDIKVDANLHAPIVTKALSDECKESPINGLGGDATEDDADLVDKDTEWGGKFCLCLIFVHFFLMSPTTTENDKENTDPLAKSLTVTPKVLKTKLKVPSASTKTVWKSNDDAVLITTLLKEQEEALQGSEKTSGGVAKTSGSCHDHWGKLKKDFAVVKKLREQFGLSIVLPSLQDFDGLIFPQHQSDLTSENKLDSIAKRGLKHIYQAIFQVAKNLGCTVQLQYNLPDDESLYISSTYMQENSKENSVVKQDGEWRYEIVGHPNADMFLSKQGSKEARKQGSSGFQFRGKPGKWEEARHTRHDESRCQGCNSK
ncbi:hypothetical protein F4604DRAFT_1682510 [Suillus subluteus]|nr:hypothetical protein F4604DRAFT_1682510 [Suillus subluteus]